MRLVVFDLDGTLLSGDTDEYWLRFLIDQGLLDHGEIEARNADIQERYARGSASAEEFCFFYLSLLRGRTHAELQPLYARFLDTVIVPSLPQAAIDLVAGERRRGGVLVLSTATNAFLSAPVGRYLGFEHIVATDPEVDVEGRFTGGCVGLPNMRAHKVPRLEQWLSSREQRLADFDETWFYSDSQNDLPLLSRVSHPVAVDPDAGLEAHAIRAGWPVLRIHPSAAPAACIAPRSGAGR